MRATSLTSTKLTKFSKRFNSEGKCLPLCRSVLADIRLLSGEVLEDHANAEVDGGCVGDLVDDWSEDVGGIHRGEREWGLIE